MQQEERVPFQWVLRMGDLVVKEINVEICLPRSIQLLIDLLLETITDNTDLPRDENREIYRENSTTDECSICLTVDTHQQVETLVCNHKFHKTCLDTWLENKNTCPLCVGDLFD